MRREFFKEEELSIQKEKRGKDGSIGERGQGERKDCKNEENAT